MYEKLKFDYAHSSLEYLIKFYKIKEIYIPYYLCDVIRHSVIKTGCKPLFYHIDDNFMPQKDFEKNSFILYPNYFGICDKNVNEMEKIYPNLIVDNAHSFFSPPQGFACFNSTRKFIRVEYGSHLYIKNNNREDEKYTKCPKSRLEEFKNLHEYYGKYNNIKIDSESARSPFCYPLLAESENEADEIVKDLETHGKTIYRYWNNLPKSYNEYKFYKRLIPIPLKNHPAKVLQTDC